MYLNFNLNALEINNLNNAPFIFESAITIKQNILKINAILVLNIAIKK